MVVGQLRSDFLSGVGKLASDAAADPGVTFRSSAFFAMRFLAALFLAPAVYYSFRKDGKAGVSGPRSSWAKTFDRLSRRALWGALFFGAVYWAELANRYAMRGSPTALALVQSLFVIASMALMWPGLKLRSVSEALEALEPWLAVSVLSAASTVTLFLCFAHVSYSVIFVVECARSVFSLAVETSILGEAIHPGLWPRWLCTCILFLGASLYLRSQVAVSRTSTIGMLLLCMHFVLSTATCVLQRYYLNIAPIKASKALLVLALHGVGAALLVCVSPLWWSREVPQFAARYSSWVTGGDNGDLQWILMSCVAAVAVSYFGIAFQQQIGATTFLAAYAAVRATLLLGNVDPVAKTTELSMVGATGLGLIIFSGTVGLAE